MALKKARYRPGLLIASSIPVSNSAAATVQWLRWKDWHQPTASLWFWRDRTHGEVDLLIEINQKIYPIECKWKERPGKSDLKGVLKLREVYGDIVAPATIACLTETAYDVAENVAARSGWVPWDLMCQDMP